MKFKYLLPGKKNQGPAPPFDTTPPEVVFASISPFQITLSFTISWLGEDLAPEGLTPAGIDGFQLRYSEDKENWNYWPSETEYIKETQFSFTGEDEKIYYFQVKAKDKAGNESQWQEVSTKISLVRNLKINEVCVGIDKASNEFIEIYNPTDFPINLSNTNFKLKLVNSSNKVTTKKISWINTIIPGKGYFLFGAGTLPIPADATYGGELMTGNSGVIITDKNDIIIDKVGWGSPPPSNAVEGEGINVTLKTGQSIERKEIALDTDNNSFDFILKEIPTPQNSSYTS